MKTIRTLEECFWSKVDIRGREDCWPWIASKRDGYGQIKIDGKELVASRVAYSLTYGEIPSGKIVCHTCDNRSCVNPSHLYVGTYSNNSRDALLRERRPKNNQKRGNKYVVQKQRQSNLGIEIEQIIEIRNLYDSGNITMRTLAKKYKVALGTIFRWVHNEMPNEE